MDFNEDDSLYSVFYGVIRLHYKRAHKFLENIGLYPGQPPLLFILNNKNGQSQKDLAEKLNIKPATLTMMIRRMEKANLLERRIDSLDQRVCRIYITDKGREATEKLKDVLKNINEECFEGFTEEEKDVMRTLFIKMRDNLI